MQTLLFPQVHFEEHQEAHFILHVYKHQETLKIGGKEP